MSPLRIVLASTLLLAPLLAVAAETPFAPAVPVAAGGSQPRRIAVADLDRDGDLDLVIALQNPARIAVRRRLPNGDYDTAQFIPDDNAGAQPAQHLRLADVDDDGDTDVLFVRQDSTLCLARNIGDGSFDITQCTATAGRIEIADMDRDGIGDLVTAAGSGTEWRSGDRSGNFAIAHTITTQRGFAGLVVADFNRDGRPDVARANDSGINLGFSVHLNPAGGDTWTEVALFSDAVTALAALDIDADGDLDLAAGRCSTTGHVIFRRNDGAAAFSSTSGLFVDAPAPGQTPCPRALLPLDLDRDGRTDLLEADSHGRVLYFRNRVEGFVLERIVADAQATTGSALHDLVAADLDNDGDADLLAAHTNEDLLARSENRSLRRSLRGGAFVSGGIAMPGAETLLVADLDRDGLRDVITASRTDNTVRFLRRTASGFATAVNLSTSANTPRGGAVADMNRDGKPDLILCSTGNSRVLQALGDGSGGFAAATIAGSGIADCADLVVLDIDRDGDEDIVVADGVLGIVRWLRNDGSGSYTQPPSLASSLAGPRAIDVIDLDRDGWPDLAVALESGNRVIALRNELRNPAAPDFSSVILSDVPEIAGPRDIAFADTDRDGLPDLFVTSTASRLSWLRQTAPGSFGPSQSLTSLTSGTGPVLAQDIDGDAHVDLVFALGGVLSVRSDASGSAGNGGYLISSSQPRLAVALADMDANSQPDLVDISANGGLSARLTEASNVRAAGDLISIPFAPRNTDLRLAGLALGHDGRSDDDAVQPRRIGFALRHTNASGALLSGTEYSQLFLNIRLFGDDGDGVYEPGIDPMLANAAASDFDAGVLSFAIPAALQQSLAFGATRKYFFVAQLSNGAINVTRQLFIGPSRSGIEAVNASYGTLLDISNDSSATTLDLDTVFRSGFQQNN